MVFGPAAATVAVVAALSAQDKAALVVVSGLPAPPGVGGVFVHRSTRHLARPRGALVFVDQEGGPVRAFLDAPPVRSARWLPTSTAAFLSGRATGRALRARGVQVDLAPVLDLSDGPLGSRHFRKASIGIAFARGLAAAGVAACVKHFRVRLCTGIDR